MSENRKDIAIKVSGVKKMYKLGQIGGGTLQADLQSWWARVRGKEDPNTKIGEGERSHGKTFMALNGIDLTIYQGEAVGIIGSNGAGKSTFLKLLSKVTAPSEGEIDIYGRIASMLEVGTGFNPEMTGRENVYLNGAILGMTKAEIDAKMDDIIEFSEVREFIDTPVKRYSSGMFVKLAFSVAAHLDSEIMIMDEVLAVGDMAFQQKCLDKMRDAAKNDGRTVLYVSHNMNTIRQLCDRCIVLDMGRVIFEGSVDKGINCYLGKSQRSSKCVDLSQINRDGDELEAKLLSMEIVGKKSWALDVGEKLKFKIRILANNELDNIGFRSRVSSIDNTSVTTLYAPNIFSSKKNEIITLELECDLSGMVPGKYCLSQTLYIANPYGGTRVLDFIDRSVTFEILTVEGYNNNVEWSIKWGGYFKVPEISIISISKLKE